MNIDNAVLVRAYKGFIPMDKELVPSCDSFYLNYEKASDYKATIKKYIMKEYENQTGKTLNPWNEED